MKLFSRKSYQFVRLVFSYCVYCISIALILDVYKSRFLIAFQASTLLSKHIYTHKQTWDREVMNARSKWIQISDNNSFKSIRIDKADFELIYWQNEQITTATIQIDTHISILTKYRAFQQETHIVCVNACNCKIHRDPKSLDHIQIYV